MFTWRISLDVTCQNLNLLASFFCCLTHCNQSAIIWQFTLLKVTKRVCLGIFTQIWNWKWTRFWVYFVTPTWVDFNGVISEFIHSALILFVSLIWNFSWVLKGFSSSYFADLKLSFTKMSCLIFIKNSWMSSLKNPLLNSISYVKKGHRILILSLLFKRLSCFPSNLFVNVTLEKSIPTLLLHVMYDHATKEFFVTFALFVHKSTK